MCHQKILSGLACSYQVAISVPSESYIIMPQSPSHHHTTRDAACVLCAASSLLIGPALLLCLYAAGAAAGRERGTAALLRPYLLWVACSRARHS